MRTGGIGMKIKVVGGTGINGYFTVDGVRMGRVFGCRSRDRNGVHANFGIKLDDGRVIATGYSYYAETVKVIPHHLKEAGVIA